MNKLVFIITTVVLIFLLGCQKESDKVILQDVSVNDGEVKTSRDSQPTEPNRVLDLKQNGDYMSIKDSPTLNIRGSITLEVKIRPVEVDGWSQIIGKGDGAGGQDPYYLRLNASKSEGELNRLEIEFGGWDPKLGGDNHAARVKLPINSTIGKWTHIAGVLDHKKDKLIIYRNGNKIREKDTQCKFGSDREMPINVGAIHSSQFFGKGQIDEVRIWKTPLSQAQIRKNMNKKLKGNETGLVGYWNFDEATFDLTSNNNHGTLMGNATLEDEESIQ